MTQKSNKNDTKKDLEKIEPTSGHRHAILLRLWWRRLCVAFISVSPSSLPRRRRLQVAEPVWCGRNSMLESGNGGVLVGQTAAAVEEDFVEREMFWCEREWKEIREKGGMRATIDK